MKGQVPVANRVIQRRQFQKSNDMLLNRIMTMKFSNISAIKTSPSPIKHKPNPHPIQYNKLVVNSDQKHTVKTVLKRENMRSQNKKIYDRLISQKSTVSAKIFAYERQKNVQFLKRIGKYPYARVQSVKLDPLNDDQANEKIVRCNTTGKIQQTTQRIGIRITQYSLSKNKSISSPFAQQQRKQHMIALYSKVTKLGKSWFTVKFLRFKNHYQIVLQQYPQPKFQYSLRLQQKIGTAMLSQNDYDYETIYSSFIKFTNQYVCFSFELNQPQQKKHFYRFQKRVSNSSQQHSAFIQQDSKQKKKAEVIKEYRKTMFAVENQKFQRQKQQGRLRFSNIKTDSRDIQNPIRRLDTVSSLDIRISADKL